MRFIAPLTIKNLTSEDGSRSFSGYGSTFGNTDRVGDVVREGAFSKSLNDHKSNGTMPSLLLHHDLNRPIGVWETMSEDAKGLYVEGRLTKGVRDADEAYNLLKDGALHSMSIGYRVVNEEYDRKTGVNYLNEIALHEVSLVTIPANAEAMITAVKDADGNPNIRELERVLRDAGLSRKEAKAVLAAGFKAIASDEEAADHEELLKEKQAAQAEKAEARESEIEGLKQLMRNR